MPVTLVDRTTRETKIKALPNREAKAVTHASISMLKAEKALSITFDSGKESSDHETMSSTLKADIYFAQPYQSWERGTNENINVNRPGYIGGNFFESECMIRIYKINHYMSDRIVSIRRQINN